MRAQQRIRIGISIFLFCLLGVIGLAIRVQAQQPNLDEAIRAVVRIRGCNSAGCNVGLGSGVIIHPSGVILTANHVTLSDSRNPLSPRLEDFVIEVTENARQAPQARYRARLIAAKPESDLALLGIYWDELTNQPLDGATGVNLPTLASADASTIGFSDQLHILGYPLAGGTSINYTEAALGGFDENGTLLKVNASLNEGYSGGPTLVERNGHYEIAGVVIRRRADVSLIRSIDQLHTLTWEPTARRVWADNVQIKAQGDDADAQLQISLNIQALDFVNRNGRLLVYAFDGDTRQPWQPVNANLTQAPNGQLVLRQDFSVEGVVASGQEVGLTIPWRELGVAPGALFFRLVLWDADHAQALWVGSEWVRAQPSVVEVAVMPTQTPTFTPPPTPTSTRRSIPTSTQIGTATETLLPTSTDTALLARTPTPSTPDLSLLTLTTTATPLRATSVPTSKTIENGPTLIVSFSPSNGSSVNEAMTIAWQADSELAPGQVYELAFWQTGGPENGRALDGASISTSRTIRIENMPDGIYSWGIWLAVTEPTYQRIRYLGPDAKIAVSSPFVCPDDGDGDADLNDAPWCPS